MSEFYSVIAGAGIALIGTITTNYFTFKITQLREEKNSERLKEELYIKSELEIRTFEHNINMNNREFIPNATKDVLNAINNLFDCTEELVLNYPGTAYTGSHPSFIFNNPIDKLITGFPDSMQEIIELSNNWYQAKKEFRNVIVENTIFLSGGILNDLNTFEIQCDNIKDYFYGRYSSIEDEQQFQIMKDEYNEQVKTYIFVEKQGSAAPTHAVLTNYEKLKKSKNDLTNDINSYQKKKTDF